MGLLFINGPKGRQVNRGGGPGLGKTISVEGRLGPGQNRRHGASRQVAESCLFVSSPRLLVSGASPREPATNKTISPIRLGSPERGVWSSVPCLLGSWPIEAGQSVSGLVSDLFDAFIWEIVYGWASRVAQLVRRIM